MLLPTHLQHELETWTKCKWHLSQHKPTEEEVHHHSHCKLHGTRQVAYGEKKKHGKMAGLNNAQLFFMPLHLRNEPPQHLLGHITCISMGYSVMNMQQLNVKLLYHIYQFTA